MSCPRGCCPDYRTHIRGINVGGFPTDVTLTERKWDLDMPAYKRLVNDGIQPAKIDGCYVMERAAKDKIEIEAGRPFDQATLSQIKDANVSL